MRSFLIGVDEVGRGALAGHVYAAAVILRNKDLSTVPAYFLNKLKDSKRLSPNKRLSIYTESLAFELIFGVGVATVKEVDQLNVLKAAQIVLEEGIGIPILLGNEDTIVKLIFIIKLKLLILKVIHKMKKENFMPRFFGKSKKGTGLLNMRQILG